MGRSKVASSMTSSEQKLRFFERLLATAAGLDPSGRTESVAYLLGRLSTNPRYEFRLTGGRLSSWSLLTDLGSIRWKAVFPLADPIDRISALQVEVRTGTGDDKLQHLQELLKGYDALKLDQLAGLVFIRDLLAATGRPTSDDAVLEKYWAIIPPKSRPKREDLPLDDSREVYALAA